MSSSTADRVEDQSALTFTRAATILMRSIDPVAENMPDSTPTAITHRILHGIARGVATAHVATNTDELHLVIPRTSIKETYEVHYFNGDDKPRMRDAHREFLEDVVYPSSASFFAPTKYPALAAGLLRFGWRFWDTEVRHNQVLGLVRKNIYRIEGGNYGRCSRRSGECLP